MSDTTTEFSLIVKAKRPASAEVWTRGWLGHGAATVTEVRTTSDPRQFVVLITTEIPQTLRARLARWFAADAYSHPPLPFGALLYYRELEPAWMPVALD